MCEKPGAVASGFFVILNPEADFFWKSGSKFYGITPFIIQMKKSQSAIENFKTLNCAQSVLLSFAGEVDLDEKDALKIALGFGGGMGMGETCGAVTGAYMVLGMKAKVKERSIQEIKTETKAAARRFNDLFLEKYGALTCKKLLGVDISTPEGSEMANQKNLFETICPKFVASAADILESEF
jgi:C_GCAxxG_C_C family probable redox protein